MKLCCPPKIIRLAFCLAIVILQTTSRADCRLDEDLGKFQSRIAVTYKLNKKTDTNYWYTMAADARQSTASPGYGIGLTISVKNNKISGESMAINLGTNRDAGFIFATLQALTFAYEAIGKPLPQGKEKTDAEINSFSQAARLALSGQPQKISYPGYRAEVIISTDNLGDLIVAAVPAAAATTSKTTK